MVYVLTWNLICSPVRPEYASQHLSSIRFRPTRCTWIFAKGDSFKSNWELEYFTNHQLYVCTWYATMGRTFMRNPWETCGKRASSICSPLVGSQTAALIRSGLFVCGFATLPEPSWLKTNHIIQSYNQHTKCMHFTRRHAIAKAPRLDRH